MSGGKRADRVGERMREELAIALRALSDPRLVGVLVTRVELSDDLGNARVYFRRELGGDAAAVNASLKGLMAASGKLRHAAAQAMGLRYTPTLKFFYDEAPDAVSRIEELLREVKGG